MILKDIKNIESILSKTDIIVTIPTIEYGVIVTRYSSYYFKEGLDWDRYKNQAHFICEEDNRPLKVKDGEVMLAITREKVEQIVFEPF